MPRANPTLNALVKLGIAVAVGGLALLLKLLLDRPRDHELCIRGKESGQTIVLIDKTDAWNANQSERLESHIYNLLDKRMKQEERFRVFSFGAAFEPGFKENFSRCKPPNGDDCWGLFCNQKQLRKQYDSDFREPLQTELKKLKVASQGACSPIAEVMHDVLSRREIKDQPGPTRIVFISDMAQNTAVYSAFRSQSPSCPGASVKASPDKDQGLKQFFEKRRRELNLTDASVLVFQVTPERRSPDVGETAMSKWKEVFQMLGIMDHWERL